MDKYYRILGVRNDADLKEIKKAYYRLAKIHHPDKRMNTSYVSQAEEEFKRINEAYCYLTNPNRFSVSDVSEKICKEHSDRNASASCIFCNSPLCDDCISRFRIISCVDCFEEYIKGYTDHLRMPFKNIGLGILSGTILGNLLGFFIPLTKNLTLSIFFSIYLIGVLWCLKEYKFKKKNRGSFIIIILILSLGWVVGFLKALIGFVPALLNYLRSRKNYVH